MSKFNVLHVSDFHFCIEPRRENLMMLLRRPKSRTLDHFLNGNTKVRLRRPESYDPDLADALAMFCVEHMHDIDLIMITGDLATTGMVSDLKQAEAFIKSKVTQGFLAQDGKPSIFHENLPILILPGNHDRYRGNNGEAGGNSFDLSFSKSDNLAYEATDCSVLRSIDGQLLGLISCDNCLKSSGDSDIPVALYKFGQGRVYDDRLEQLRRHTESVRETYNGVYIAWLSHFPIYPDVERTLSLRYKDSLIDLANSMDVSLIFSGHIHAFRNETIRGVVNISADASLSIDRCLENQIHLIELECHNGSINASVQHFRYSTRDGAFELVN